MSVKERKREKDGEEDIQNKMERIQSEQNNGWQLGVDNTGKCKSQYANANNENVCLTER